MAVPYTFANATVSIPLSELDSNFATTITLGNTAIELGNTVTTLNNMTLANVTVSSGNATFTTANVTNMSSSNVTITGGTIANVTISGSGSNITATNINASNVTVSTDLTLSGGTANGVAYLNGSKVLTTGSALTFDGTNLGVGTSTAGNAGTVNLSVGAPGTTVGGLQLWTSTTGSSYLQWGTAASGTSYYRGYLQYNYNSGSDYLAFGISAAEQMRLTSTGLGIGTSSPEEKLTITATNPTAGRVASLRNNGSSSLTGTKLWFNQNTVDNWNIGQPAGVNAFVFCNSTDSTNERMRLDSSGNLGLGVTPSAWSYRSLSVGTAGTAIWQTASDFGLSQNAYNNGGWKYATTGAAALYDISNNVHVWYQAPSGTAGNAISFTQAMTLDASGNLALGLSGASYRFDMSGTATAGMTVLQQIRTGTGNSYGFQIKGNYTTEDYLIQNYYNGYLAFGTNNAERMRIDSSGNLLVGATSLSSGSEKVLIVSTAADYTVYARNSNASPYGYRIYYPSAAPNGTGNHFLYCDDNAALRAAIKSNGGFSNYQANDTNLSDRNEKTDFAPAKPYLDVICSIPVQTFKYVDQTDDEPTLGVVAQDVQAVAPELVMESDWGIKGEPKVRLSIYQTDLQYALMKCIQELKAELDATKAEVAALKGK